MTKTVASPSQRLRPLPGTGRLGIVSAYFGLYGLVGAVATVAIAVGTFVPALGWRVTPSNQFAALAGIGVLTFGFLRTYRLLQERRRSGALLAALCLAGSVVTDLATGRHDWTVFALPVVGIALLASVWRHVDASP